MPAEQNWISVSDLKPPKIDDGWVSVDDVRPAPARPPAIIVPDERQFSRPVAVVPDDRQFTSDVKVTDAEGHTRLAVPETPWITGSATPAADAGLTGPIEAVKRGVSGAVELGRRVLDPLFPKTVTGAEVQRGTSPAPTSRIGADQPPVWSIRNWDDDTKQAVTDTLTGALALGSGAVLPALLAAPATTVLTGAAIWAAGAGADKAAEAFGGSETDRKLARAMAEAVAAVGGVKALTDALSVPAKAVAESAKATGRAVSLAGRLSMPSSYGPSDYVPGLRGEPYTLDASARMSEGRPSPGEVKVGERTFEAGSPEAIEAARGVPRPQGDGGTVARAPETVEAAKPVVPPAGWVDATDVVKAEPSVASDVPKPANAEPYTKAVVHITTPEGKTAIESSGFDLAKTGGIGGDTYGPGVYLADHASDAGSFWREQLATKNDTGEVPTASLAGAVDLKRALVVEDMTPAPGSTYGVMTSLPRRDLVRKYMPAQLARFDALVQENGGSQNQAVGQLAREAGYDGIVFQRRAGDEIVAFDPKAVDFGPKKDTGPFPVWSTAQARWDEMVQRTIAEGQAAGVPDNPVAQRLEAERTAAPTQHEFSSTQVQLPPATAAAIKAVGAKIPDEHLAVVKAGEDAPPRDLSAYVSAKDYKQALRATYGQLDGTRLSSRDNPQTAAIPPVGTWRIASDAGQSGREIEQLVTLPVDNIEISEDTGRAKHGDVKQYAEWLLAGRAAPPIDVLQTHKGTLKTMDHRRLLAAKAAGQDTIRAWVSRTALVGPHPRGWTYELAQAGVQPIPIEQAKPENTIFVDDAKALEKIREDLQVSASAKIGAPSDAAQGTDVTAAVVGSASPRPQGQSPAGPGRQDGGTQYDPADVTGALSRVGEASGARLGRVRRDDLTGIVFKRAWPKANAKRITPEVHRELVRMADEMNNFPFVPDTWTDLSHESGARGKSGNAGGGGMNKVSRQAGAAVYDDILGESPMAVPDKKGARKGQLARKVAADRPRVEAVIREVIATKDIKNHLAEGAVRVAEKRAAGQYGTSIDAVSRPWLPAHWEPREAPPVELDAVIDDLVAKGDTGEGIGDETQGDTSFDTSEFDAPTGLDAAIERNRAREQQKQGDQQAAHDRIVADFNAGDRVDTLDTGESQPRLPGAEDARQVGQADVTFRAPVQASGEDFSLETPLTDEQKAAEAKADVGPSLFEDLDVDGQLDAIRSGKPLFKLVYHGSPHRFEQFKLQHVGAGQGAQSFGWGMYVADVKDIAKGYRDTLSEVDAQVEGGGRIPDWVAHTIKDLRLMAEREPWTVQQAPDGDRDFYLVAPGGEWGDKPFESREEAMRRAPKNKNDAYIGMQKLVDEFKGRVEEEQRIVDAKESGWWNHEERLRNVTDILASLEKVKAGAKVQPAGRLYEIDIPDDAEFLEWDKNASQQTPKVQAALKALGVSFETFEPKSLKQFMRWIEGPTAQGLAASDVGIRQSLRKGYLLAKDGDVAGVARWQEQHQGYFNKGMVDPSGETAYDQIKLFVAKQNGLPKDWFLNSAEGASKALLEHGIAGIRYLDGHSRDAGEGTANYVVFDDSLLNITDYEDTPSFSQRAEQSETTFYSALTRAAEDLPQAKGTGKQMLAMLIKAKGVKAEEIQWSGIEPWLNQQESVTKTAIVDYLRANELQVSEKMLGGPEQEVRTDDKYTVRKRTDGKAWVFVDSNGRVRGGGADTEEGVRAQAEEWASDVRAGNVIDDADNTPTKFAQHTLPGGENYRELLITLPVPLTTDQIVPDAKALADHKAEWDALVARYDAVASKPGPERDALDAEMDAVHAKGVQETALRMHPSQRQVPFTSGHFDEPNVVAHVRMNDRQDSDGKKVLFIEEIQSDLHQKGRKHGYKVAGRLIDGHDAAWWSAEADRRFNLRTPTTGVKFGNEPMDWPYEQREAEWQEAIANRNTLAGRPDEVPDAPFKTTWPELAMKRVVRYAAEHGYDRIAWTTGEQQNDRYDLSQQVGAIEYNPETQQLAAYNHVGEPVITRKVAPDQLEDHIGKDVAKKLLDAPLESPKPGDAKIHTLTGVELKVGGSGMKGFYDDILPRYMNKFGKPFGARVGTVAIDVQGSPETHTGLQERREYVGPRMSAAAIDEVGRSAMSPSVRISTDVGRQLRDVAASMERGAGIEEAMQRHGSMAAAEAIGGEMRRVKSVLAPVHSIDVTDQMRETALQGLPLFARSDRLSVLHNLTAENLIFADKMGGLSVPSLAVVPGDMSMKGMGDITLIGRADLADPSHVPVHDADVYSPTFPRAEYDKARSADAQKVLDRIKPYGDRFDDYNAKQVTWDNAVNNPKPDAIVQTWLNGPAAKALFLHEQGVEVEPVVVPAKLDLPWVKYLDYEAFREAIPFNDERTSAETAASQPTAKAELLKAVDLYLTKDRKGKALMASIATRNEGRPGSAVDDLDAARVSAATVWGSKGDWILDAAEPIPGHLDWKITDSHNKLGTKAVERAQTRKRVDAALKGKEVAFKQWVDDTVMGMFGRPFVRVRGRKEPYTLANIVDAMSGPVRAQEDTMVYGEGKARAAAAKRFKDLEQMRRAAGNIADESTISASREEAKKLIEEYRGAVVPYYGEESASGSSEFGRTWEGLDASMRALARWAKGAKTETNMRWALAREGFNAKRIPSFVYEDAVAAGTAWLKAPVPYFEAKPQRAVRLSEFAGAVIPSKASLDVRAVLDKHGIPYREYMPGKGDASVNQQAAVVKFRKELSKTDPDVLFSKPEPVGAGIPKNLRDAAMTQRDVLRKTYDEMQSIPLAGRAQPTYILDAGSRFTPTELKAITDDVAFQRVAKAQMDMLDAVGAAMRKLGILTEGGAEVERTGILLSRGDYGVWLPHQGKSGSLATILLGALEQARGNSLQKAADIAYETAAHEWLHKEIARDGPDFERALAGVLVALGEPFRATQVSRIMRAYGDPNRPGQYNAGISDVLRTYSESRGRRATAADSISLAERDHAQPRAERGTEGQPARSLREGGSRTVTAAELEVLAERLGTSVEAQRARVEAKGYTVEKAEHGVTLQSTILPGAAEFGEHVIEPAVAKVAEAAAHERGLFLSVLAPQKIGVAPLAAGKIRAHTAANDQRKARVAKAMKRYAQIADGWSEAQNHHFIDVMQGLERLDSLAPKWQAVAKDLRAVLDKWTTLLVEKDLLQNYLEHYWPQEWQQKSIEGKILQKLFGRRPVQGSEAYRKHRTIPTNRQGRAFGLVEAETNPFRQFERKVFEMSQSVKGRLLHEDFVKDGLYAYVPATKTKPEAIADWVRVPDYALGVKYGARVPEQTFGRVIAGYYYAPREVVRLIENHLSPGLHGRSVIFDLYNKVGNLSTQFILGWSTYHLWLTGLESVISKQALVGELTSRGEIAHAARKQMEVGPQGVIKDLIRGYKAVQSFYERDADANDTTGLIGQIVQAGGGLGWSAFEHEQMPAKFMVDVRTIVGAVRRMDLGTVAKKAVPVVAHGAGALFELPTTAIMTHWVPYLKVSAFLDLAEMELRRMGPNASLEDQRTVLGSAWDTVDDRFGQLRYDNMFWNNTFKQVLMGGFLSVGWQVGSLRAGLGALGQGARLVQNMKALASGGGSTPPAPPGIPMRRRALNGPDGEPVYERQVQPWLQRNMAWLFSLAILVGFAGAIKQYLSTKSKTGKGLYPGELRDGGYGGVSLALRDLFAPRNGELGAGGREERDTAISYLKDYYAWTHHPISTVGHKLKPFLSMLWETAKNEDFYGTEIRNADDPAMKQLAETLWHFVERSMPISGSNALHRSHAAATPMEKLKTWAQIQATPFTPANAELERSAMENYLQALMPPVHRSQEQAERAKDKAALRDAIRSHDTAAQQRLTAKGNITNRERQAAVRATHHQAFEYAFQRASMGQALSAYGLGTPEERQVVKMMLTKKFYAEWARTPTVDRPALRTRYNTAMALPSRAVEAVH